MKAKIFCEATDRGAHSFYLISEGKTYYLFSQNYRKGVQEYFGKGVYIDQSTKYSKAHNDSAITRTMSKIPMYVRYVEKEYSIEVYERTKKSSRRAARPCEMKCA